MAETPNYRGMEWAEYLIEIADSTRAPMQSPTGSTHHVFDTDSGWKVDIFYRVGQDLHYIDHFIDPEGNVVDFWDWPGESDFAPDDACLLMAWCGPPDPVVVYNFPNGNRMVFDRNGKQIPHLQKQPHVDLPGVPVKQGVWP